MAATLADLLADNLADWRTGGLAGGPANTRCWELLADTGKLVEQGCQGLPVPRVVPGGIYWQTLADTGGHWLADTGGQTAAECSAGELWQPGGLSGGLLAALLVNWRTGAQKEVQEITL